MLRGPKDRRWFNKVRGRLASHNKLAAFQFPLGDFTFEFERKRNLVAEYFLCKEHLENTVKGGMEAIENCFLVEGA